MFWKSIWLTAGFQLRTAFAVLERFMFLFHIFYLRFFLLRIYIPSAISTEPECCHILLRLFCLCHSHKSHPSTGVTSMQPLPAFLSDVVLILILQTSNPPVLSTKLFLTKQTDKDFVYFKLIIWTRHTLTECYVLNCIFITLPLYISYVLQLGIKIYLGKIICKKNLMP